MDNMECRCVWLYLVLIHFTLTLLLINAAPTTEIPYIHDTSNGMSENKSRVDMTQIPFTDHHDDAAPQNFSSMPTTGAGRVQTSVPSSIATFAHETTTYATVDVSGVSETGNKPTTPNATETSRPTENILLTTILYPSTSVPNPTDVKTEGIVMTQQPTSTEDDGEKWKSTETYFINGLSDLLMENSGIDRIAEFVDEIANQQNFQMEKMDSSTSTSEPPTQSPTESVEKIAEQVTNSMVKSALNTEVLEEGGENITESTTNLAPSSNGMGYNSETTTENEKNDSISVDTTTEKPHVASTISQFTPQFDILTVTTTVNPHVDGKGLNVGTETSIVDTSTKKSKSTKLKKKVSKASVESKKPFTIKSTAMPQADIVHSTSSPAEDTTTQVTYTTNSGPNEILTTTETTEAPVTVSTATPSEAMAETTPKGRRDDWTGDDYSQPENEDDVLVVEIEDTENFTEVSHSVVEVPGIKDEKPEIKQSNNPQDMTDELFFPILVDRPDSADSTTVGNVVQDVPKDMSTKTPSQNVNHDKTEAPIDRDSDTFFYISNTEVKVVESVPTPDTHKENNFFPEIYEEDVFIDFSNKNHSHRGMASDKLEEDIILSPLNFDPLNKQSTQKIHYNEYSKQTNFQNNYNSRANDANLEHNTDGDDNNLSISYIGESFIEIKESTTEMDSNNLISPLNSDVIIQPVAMPEVPLSIGVPVIGELPPQIELMPAVDTDTHEAQLHHNFEIDLRDTSHVFAHPGDYLVKNPSISAEIPILESSTSSPAKHRNASAAGATGQTPFVDDGDLDTSMSDLQTLFTACLATLTLLMVVLVIVFGVRYLWRKYRPDQLAVNGLIADSSTDPLAIKSRTLSTDEDISRDARETKMHYSPSEKDGVFVVEVARGADSTGLAEEFSKNNQDILLQQKSNIEFTGPGVDQKPLIEFKTDPATDHQEVQIHDPPPAEKAPARETIIEVDEVKEETLMNHSKTGLTQSDLSVSSSNGSNKDYCYGSQESYTVDSKGYKGSSPRISKMDGRNDPETPSNSEDGEETFINRKPIVTGAIYKQDTLDFESSIPLDSNDVSTGKSTKEDQLINEQHQLGNGEISATVDEENKKKDDSQPVVNGDAERENFTYPEPPSSEEIKYLNDSTVIENNMDSLPPPPPVDTTANQSDEQTLLNES
ncbi:uncharacterized protein LOC129805735 isoform X2 [Phlebotomus papatasi]|uniref:uncharacterized protein LOC129805735 isoform X2 n=1 Tax=Phlebotomus papatasi TaxID=29031 RepID=UPI00248451F8|nr:uncharacterized protein LOC129805735 isoform X2 [Phlebotomus papatasi]